MSMLNMDIYFEHLNQEEAVGLANYLRISIWNFNLGWAINNFRCYGFPLGGGGPVGAHFHPLGSTPTPHPLLQAPVPSLHPSWHYFSPHSG